MTATTLHTAFGRPALETLARVVADAQAGDPLAAVTVVVPSNAAGLGVRRLIGSGAVDGRRGVANLTVTTPHQLAAHLGVARASSGGRVPISNPVLAAVSRRALASRPGSFEAVAAHPATEQALVRVYGEVSHLDASVRDRLRTEGRAVTADLMALVDEMRGHLIGGHYDEDDVARAATAAVRSGESQDLGVVALHLIGRLSSSHRALVDALEGQHRVVSIVGHTGVAAADAALRPVVIGTDLGGPPFPVPEVTKVMSVSDPDEEVRATVRHIAGALERGTSLDRMAVLYPTAEPYARTLHEQLDAAGMAWNGPGVGRLSQTAAGRTLLRFLALPGRRLARDAVIDLVSGAPVRDRDGRLVAAARWDRLSRDAGVVAGAEDWRDKLASHAAGLESRLVAAREDDRPGRVAGLTADVAELERLRAFVDWLAPVMEAPDPTWRGRADWATFVLRELLGAEPRRASWPEDETRFAAQVADVLERLAGLDRFDPHPGDDVFVRSVIDELDTASNRRGRVGVGVTLGPLAASPGLDAEVMIVLGMAEGTCPASRSEDSLLPDVDRRLADGQLEVRSEQIDLDHAHLLVALAAGSAERVLVQPRGDHRNGRTRLPSRWLLEAESALVGHRVHSSEHDELVHPAIMRTASFVAGLSGSAPAASVADLDLRTLLASGGPSVGDAVTDGDLLAGLEAAAARRSADFTRFDGNLLGVPLPSPVDGPPLSATRIQTWATCPFSYFLGYVLGVGGPERPERITEIGALDQGSLVHEVLERFGREVVGGELGGGPRPEETWTVAQHRRLHVLAEEVCDEYEAKGLTGRPLLWRLRRVDLLEDFTRLLLQDDLLRSLLGVRWEAVEAAFGMDGAAPVELTLGDGRVARFRGMVDRLDRRVDGEAVVVDYKTGRPPDHLGELEEDPVVRGRVVQLALYAEAARQHHGGDRPGAWYWYATSRGGFAIRGYQYGPHQEARFRSVLDRVVTGIEQGRFPARSGPFNNFWRSHENCGFCEFDGLCARDRHEQWQAKAAAPELADYVELAEPSGDDGGAS